MIIQEGRESLRRFLVPIPQVPAFESRIKELAEDKSRLETTFIGLESIDYELRLASVSEKLKQTVWLRPCFSSQERSRL